MSFDLIALVIGRALLGGLFLVAGISHAFIYRDVVPGIAARGLPFPGVVLAIGSVFEGVCGLLLVLGLFVPLAAGGLVIFTIVATIMFLNFWDHPAGPARNGLRSGALTNVALIGGLLIAVATG